jgi:predicted regulator of Ras-like GTPase activity (Roadblock/LC7/MglB family)
MTQKLRFMEGMKVLPIYSPASIVADDPVATSYVDLAHINWATLAIHFGVITCDTPVVTLECSTVGSSNATEVAIGFQYRLSTAVDTDDSAAGTITTATSTGVTVAAGDDGKVLLIEVDPSAIAAVAADMRWVRAVIDQGDASAAVAGAVAYMETKYPGNATISST